MYLSSKFLLTCALSLSIAGAALADAYATGEASVNDVVIGFGSNTFGGTGLNIGISLFSTYNGSFAVFGSGPGTGSLFYGNGLLDGGFDAGSGAGWSLYGENDVLSNGTANFGDSDASNMIGGNGTVNFATEDTYNEMLFAITNNSATKGEFYNIEMADGVFSEVSLDNATNEYGLDEALLEFGYADATGALTSDVQTNQAYILTGMSYGSDTFDFVENNINDYYQGFLKPGQTIYIGVISENYSAVQATVSTPGPAAIAPFAVGVISVLRRRKRS